MSALPPYSELAPAEGSILGAQATSNTIAGYVQTCSINDRQHATARFTTNPKKGDPIAMICGSPPHLDSSKWYPMGKYKYESTLEYYRSSIPVVKVPGLEPSMQSFSWQTLFVRPNYELLWDGPAPLQSARSFTTNNKNSRFVIATCSFEDMPNDIIVEITRGGGLEFELLILLQIFVIRRMSKYR